MSTKIGINGFGRIGRDYLRYVLASDDIEVVARDANTEVTIVEAAELPPSASWDQGSRACSPTSTRPTECNYALEPNWQKSPSTTEAGPAESDSQTGR